MGTAVAGTGLDGLVERPPAGIPRAVAADALGFRYPGAAEPALRDVSFHLDAGGLLLVVGPSGSGKSTLARAISGLATGAGQGTAAWAGRLWVGNVDVTTEPRGWIADDVGVVFQDPGSQLVMDRVEDDVAFGLENRAWRRAAMRARVPEALATAGLPGFEHRRSGRLSGGEQQRLALAGAVAPEPGVLVLDEPTANLDPAGTRAVFERLDAIRRARSATVVLVEHRVDLAWPLADLVLALGADGTPIDLGAPAEVLARSGERMRAAGIWLPGDGPTAATARAGAAARSLPAATPRSEPILALDGVRFAYERGRPAIRDMSLELQPGERVALVGANGSGKSTLLRLAVGLLAPLGGAVRLLGTDPRRMPVGGRARAVGYVHQDPELGFLADTVDEELRMGLAPDEAAGADELMERLGLPLGRFGDRSPYRLSGGEQRRLSLATALIRRPRLLVLDEPTFGQDRHGHEALVAIIGELVGERTALLAATHDERFVRDATDRRVELAEGWLVGSGASR